MPRFVRHFLRPIIVLAFGISCAAALGQGHLCTPLLKAIQVKVGSTGAEGSHMDFHYCIYFGDEESARSDDDAGREGCQQTLFLLHPVPEAASRMAVPAPHRWYAIFQTAGGSSTRGLLEEATWLRVPAAAQHVLLALGVDDPDLLLISCQFLSGSISVCYHPRFDHDCAFYQQKLETLEAYFASHDSQESIPVGRVVHGQEGLVRATPAVPPLPWFGMS